MLRRRAPLALWATAAPILVFASPAGAGGGCHAAGEGQTTGSGDRVDMVDMCMTPTVLHVDEGRVVTFTNKDGVEHNLYGVGWGTDRLGRGDAHNERFDDAGTFPYTCTLHPGMNGAIVVGDEAIPTEPIASVTAEQDNGATSALPVVAAGVGALGVGYAVGRRRRA